MMKSIGPVFGLLALTAALSGCETLNKTMSMVDDTINGASDVASGDLRVLAGKRQATLQEIWTDWQANEVSAKKKWDRQTLSVPGVITRITIADSALKGEQIVVFFRDPKNAKCVGSASTRDALMVNQNRISNLKKGDRVQVSGVLANTPSMWSDTSCTFLFEKAKIEKQA